MLEKLSYNLVIAVESIFHNRLRALLTSLGIIFGVASVISMLAIGRGAQQEIIEQIHLLGANNIIVTPVVEQKEGPVEEDEGGSDNTSGSGKDEKKPFSPGLSLADAESIEHNIPGVYDVSVEVVAETMALRAGRRRSMKLVGVDGSYFANSQLDLAEGTFFTQPQLTQALPVCIIGQDARTKFFPKEEALGKTIKVGNLWLTVVGVLQHRALASQNLDHLGLRNYNLDIYTPVQTFLLRYENRALVTRDAIQRSQRDRRRGVPAEANYHQLDRIVVRVESSAYIRPVSDVITRMLQRRHYGVVDYQVVIPEQLLQQEQRTQTIFNVVLAAIASISLIVGGIGIMNIMLASVMERIREIGVRRSVGATRRDVILQFLIEAITLSFTGGVLGILLGVALSIAIERSTDITTVVSAESVLLAFLVSVSVGIIFGILPARRAAEQDPVEALRHE